MLNVRVNATVECPTCQAEPALAALTEAVRLGGLFKCERCGRGHPVVVWMRPVSIEP